MSSVVIAGDTSGTITLDAPAVAGSTVLTLPATSGTFLTTTGGVAPGTSGNILTSNGTAWTSAALPAIGVGQTWQDLTGSRALATTYTNSSGKPIMVQVTVQSNSSGQVDLTSIVAGTTISNQLPYVAASGFRAFTTFIVPNGSTYSITTTGSSATPSLSRWTELR
jgi:hypothetical protein